MVRNARARSDAGGAGLLDARRAVCADVRVRLTTERKVCAGILSLAMAALAVDRLVLGGASGPASASAAELLAVEGVGVAAENAGPETRLSLPTGEPVAKQLASLGSVPALADAFAPPARWMEEIRRAAAEAQASRDSAGVGARVSDDPVVAGFLQRHQLTAVLSEGGKPDRALVKVAAHDGQPERTRLLRVGDVLDGFTLLHLEVSKDKGRTTTSATFSDPGGSSEAVTLTIRVSGE